MTGEKEIKILVVDDDFIVQKFVSHILKAEGYTVEVAGDGVEALETIYKNTFDVILLDVNMPNLDGIKMKEILNKKHIDTPVIFLSGDEQESLKLRGLEAGVAECLSKPFSRDLLLAGIKKVLK